MNDEYVSFKCIHFAAVDRNDPDEREAIAYADVDGYPDDEQREGTVICRIWMMRDKNAVNPWDRFKYIVDWHNNGYRKNESVLELVKQAKKDLKEFFYGIVVEPVFKKAFARYKLKWLLDHNYTIDEVLAKMQEEMDKNPGTIEEAFKAFEEGYGFDGLLWGSENEFRDEEWQDQEYMSELLSSDDYAIWKDR